MLRKSSVVFLLSTLRNIHVLLGEVIYMVRKHSRKSCTVGVQKCICIVDFASGLARTLSKLLCFDKKVFVLMF